MNDQQLRAEVGHRLRVTAHELGYRSAQALADWLGANRAQVAAWFNAVAMPPVKYMRRLRAEHHIPLDWIYAGDGSGLPHGIYIRLIAAMEAGTPPPDVEPEPEPEPDSAVTAYPLRKAGAGGRPPARQKRASAA